MFLRKHPLWYLLPLPGFIQQLLHRRPFLPHRLCLLLTPDLNFCLHILWVHQHTLCQFRRIKNYSGPALVFYWLKVKSPQQPRNRQEHGAFGNVHSLADATSSTKDVLVSFGGIRNGGGLSRTYMVVCVARRVEDTGVGIVCFIIVYAPIIIFWVDDVSLQIAVNMLEYEAKCLPDIQHDSRSLRNMVPHIRIVFDDCMRHP